MARDSGKMDGMARMGGSGMMSLMPAHLDSMTRLNPGQMSQTMAAHERIMSEMLDQMGGEMRQMKMAETPEWSALTDSVRRDLAALPALRDQALRSRMQGHVGRVQRLIETHEQMMKGTH